MGTNEREPNGTENQPYQHAEAPEKGIKNRLNRCLGVALGVIIAVGTTSIGKATDPQNRDAVPAAVGAAESAVDECKAMRTTMGSMQAQRTADRNAIYPSTTPDEAAEANEAIRRQWEKMKERGCY